jgi:hypothetical protein
MKGSVRERLTKLFAMLGSDNANERENARTIIDEILRRNRKSWNDLTELLQTGSDGTDWNIQDNDETPPSASTGANINALDLVKLARLLAPFGIRPRTIWPCRRNQKSKSSKGYFRSQFEPAWSKYCNSAGTAAQPRKSARLWRN